MEKNVFNYKLMKPNLQSPTQTFHHNSELTDCKKQIADNSFKLPTRQHQPLFSSLLFLSRAQFTIFFSISDSLSLLFLSAHFLSHFHRIIDRNLTIGTRTAALRAPQPSGRYAELNLSLSILRVSKAAMAVSLRSVHFQFF